MFESYNNLVESGAVNEAGEKAGTFGWCVMSRKPANYYCKESRFPIHSLEDKISYLETEDAFCKRNQENVLLREKYFKRVVQETLMTFNNILGFAFSTNS